MPDIIPIPAFSDNYIWLLINPINNTALIVDPGDASPVRKFCQRNHIIPVAILITHHHHDHVGGVAELAQHYNIPVYGPRGENMPAITHSLTGGETLEFSQIEGVKLDVLSVPGHTAHHIAYTGADALFCGDTLFAGGCGRLLGGTAQQLFDSLNLIKQLPRQTKIYCAHEYTTANLSFAKTVEPDNSSLQKRIKITKDQIEKNGITLPSLLAEELATNPFLRCDQPTIQAHTKQSNPFETFKALRQLKDHWSSTK